MKALIMAVLMAAIFLHCGPSINQAVQLNRINYDFHVITYIDDGEEYYRGYMNVPWIDVEFYKALEYRRAEIYIDMLDDYEITNWEVIIK
jgi:hypothetical protein